MNSDLVRLTKLSQEHDLNESEIIKNVYLRYIDIDKLTDTQLKYYSEVINNPLNCSLEVMLEFTGAKKV